MFKQIRNILMGITIILSETSYADVVLPPVNPRGPVVTPTTPRLHVIGPDVVPINTLNTNTTYIDPPLGIRLDEVPVRKLGQDTFAGLPADSLWAKISASDNTIVIGIKAPGTNRGIWKATRLISRPDVESYASKIGSMAGVETIIYRDPILPVVVARLINREAFDAIRQLPYIDYVEPGNFELHPLDGIGCEKKLPTWIGQVDTSGDIIPRSFSVNGIDRAWKRNVSGQGINIGVVDTGIYRAQQEFWPDRFSSVVNGARLFRYGNCVTQQCIDALPANAFDECNHGTRIAGTIAAPRDGANIVGVAYNANLHAVKAANGVWSDPFIFNHFLGIRAVRNAGARIIEMAFGGTFNSSLFADEIGFEYNRTDRPEVFFVGAAGTNVCPFYAPVAFPARLPEVFAVTGVNRDGTLAKDVCTGPEVDLAAVLEDFETTGDTLGSVITLGGSSGTSALVSGIAALVWSQNPSLTRAQLISRLQSTAKISPSLGIGMVDAYAATGGIRSARIVGPTNVIAAGQNFTLRTSIIGDGPFSFAWDRGETTASVNRTGPGTSSVAIRDLTDNTVTQLSFSTKTSPTPNSGGRVSPQVCLRKPWTPGCDR